MIPPIRQSGKKRFTKGPAILLGNARLRKSLWMVVLQVIRRNSRLGQYEERLRAAGRPGKVAVIAAMRKLLIALWSVATHTGARRHAVGNQGGMLAGVSHLARSTISAIFEPEGLSCRYRNLRCLISSDLMEPRARSGGSIGGWCCLMRMHWGCFAVN